MLKNFKGVTVSGPDTETDIATLVGMQTQNPYLEVGVLWATKAGLEPRYPSRKWIEKATELGLNFSLHLCGKYARDMVENGIAPEIPGKPNRIQINCNGMVGYHGWWKVFEHAPFNNGTQFIIQVCDHIGSYWIGGAQGDGHHVVPLFDKSGGKGISVETEEWAKPLPLAPWQVPAWNGFAGGIRPDNIVNTAQAISATRPGYCRDFWLDMESGLRTDGKFDLDKVTQIINLVDPMIERAANREVIRHRVVSDQQIAELFWDYKPGDTVVATVDFQEYNPHDRYYENIAKGETDVVESVSSDHHGGLQLNLVRHGRGWSNHVWRKQ